ncbi:MAG TPA: PilZ domain-containing protein [Candidatus Polarisedimenticolia bacterium]|nr:PilZ domain-containing protein [Candidatus Polarisedimenticolia bacterium]
MERREKPAWRYRKRVEVRYGPDEPSQTGYSGNISSTGIMIRTTRVFAPGTTLTLELKLPGGTVRARGRVRWAREGSVTLLSTGRVGMGVTLIDPPAELLELIPESLRGTGR